MSVQTLTVSSTRKDVTQIAGFALLLCCIFITIFFLGTLIVFVAVRGIGVLSWEFITQVPRDAMTAGGVAPAIVGTFYLPN